MQQFLYFLPLQQGHGSFLPIFLALFAPAPARQFEISLGEFFVLQFGRLISLADPDAEIVEPCRVKQQKTGSVPPDR